MRLSETVKHLQPGDPILVVVLVGLAFWGWLGPGADLGSVSIRITSADTVLVIAPTDTVRVIGVNGPLGVTKVELGGGEGLARIIKSPCPHRFCIRSGAIDRPGAPLVCVPNGVVVELVGGRAEMDGTTR